MLDMILNALKVAYFCLVAIVSFAVWIVIRKLTYKTPIGRREIDGESVWYSLNTMESIPWYGTVLAEFIPLFFGVAFFTVFTFLAIVLANIYNHRL